MGLYTYDYLLSQKQAKGFHRDNPTNCCSLFLRTNLPWLVYLLGPIYQQLWPHEITTCQLIPSGMFLLPEISCRIKLYTKGPWLSRISTWKLTIKNITPCTPGGCESPSLVTKTARWIWSLGGATWSCLQEMVTSYFLQPFWQQKKIESWNATGSWIPIMWCWEAKKSNGCLIKSMNGD